MRQFSIFAALCLTTIACKGPETANARDSAVARLAIDTPAPAPPPAARPADSSKAAADGKEPGTIPATPTPTVTSASSITAMRMQLQRLDSASAQALQSAMTDYAKKLGDLMTTMEVEVQASTNPAKNSWLALSDTIDGDLKKLAMAQGEELRTAFRAHRLRVTQLLDGFRSIIPAK